MRRSSRCCGRPACRRHGGPLAIPPRIGHLQKPAPACRACESGGVRFADGTIGAKKKGGPRLHPRCARPPITSASMVASIAEKVKSHGEKIEQGQATPYAGACPRCGQNKGFGRHQIRRREFRVIVDGWVRLIPSWICRWKCKACGKTFTDCPPFDSRRRTAAIPSIRSNNSLLPI